MILLFNFVLKYVIRKVQGKQELELNGTHIFCSNVISSAKT